MFDLLTFFFFLLFRGHEKRAGVSDNEICGFCYFIPGNYYLDEPQILTIQNI